MASVFVQLLEDFLTTILFLTAYLLSGSVYVATGIAIIGAVAQFGYRRVTGRSSHVMQWLSLGLVLVLGSASLLTQDGRFIMAKPSIIHFAIGAVMLRRGWMMRYLPPIVREHVPETVLVAAGYAWAGLMVVLGVANLVISWAFSVAIWGWFIAVVAPGAKVVAFALQYFVFRTMIRRRIIQLRASPAAVSGTG